MMKKAVLMLLISPMPWAFRRAVMQHILGYSVHRDAFISRFALVLPSHLVMEAHASIAAFTVAIHLDSLELKEHASIGRSNWISGFPKGSNKHFAHVSNRNPKLILGAHSAITKQHIIDCTHSIEIGSFTTIAGYRSQFLTHSIDYVECRQNCSPIKIGDYCLIGTGCIFLPGTSLASHSICGAGSIVNKDLNEEYRLYAGSPAASKKALDKDAKYFTRTFGYVD